MNRSIQKYLSLIALSFFPLAALADTLYMKNGDILSGKMISFSNGFCVFGTKYGASINVSNQDIIAIDTDENYSVIFKNDDTASGKLVKNNFGKTHLISSNFGEVEIQVNTIKSIVKIHDKKNNSEENSSKESKNYGQNTEKTPPLDFLTGSTVMLSPGNIEIDIDTRYRQRRESYSLSSFGYFQKSSYSAKQLELNTSIRAGLANDLEGYLTLPLIYSNVEQVSTNEFVRSKGRWGVGDISFGLQYQLLRETVKYPAISVSLDVSAPTGKKRYYPITEAWQDPLNNGSGHWSVSPGIAFVRTTDPAILFGGLSYRYSFSNTIDGYHIKPGSGVAGYFGVGFALNERLSLGSRFSYSSYKNMKVNGETVHGSDTDPMDISLSASYRFSDDWVMTPQVTFGVNDEAGPTILSFRLNRRFN